MAHKVPEDLMVFQVLLEQLATWETLDSTALQGQMVHPVLMGLLVALETRGLKDQMVQRDLQALQVLQVSQDQPAFLDQKAFLDQTVSMVTTANKETQVLQAFQAVQDWQVE